MAGCWFAPAGSSAAPRPAAASGNPPVVVASVAPGVVTGTDQVTLLAQPSWVPAPQGVFRLRLGVTAHDPGHEQIRINVYSRLVTRTDFDGALRGQFNSVPRYPLALDLAKLPSDPAGGVDVDIPVNQDSTNPDIPRFYAAAGSGVFPIQVGISDSSGTPQGRPLTTYMVYAESFSASQVPRLSVALVLPVHTAPALDSKGRLEALPADQSRALADLVDRLGRHPRVHLSLAVTPQTLDALAAGSALDKSTLSALAQLADNGRAQILPSTYTADPLRGWDAVGLGDEFARQLGAGTSVLDGVFGNPVQPATWAVNGPLDTSALHTLVARGATHFILPDAELSPLPALAQVNTFAVPTELLGTGAKTSVYGADPGITADFSNPGGPVLAATQLLAELAMIQLEQPGDIRGVAVLPPPGWNADPTFVDTLLAGLDGDPLLNAVTASGLFKAVPVASLQRSVALPQPSTATTAGSTAPTGSNGSNGSGSPGSTSASTATTLAPGLLADAGALLGPDAGHIRAVRQQLSGLEAILPQAAQQAQALDRDLLTSESSDLTESQRQALLGAVSSASQHVTSLIKLPPHSSITLTSNRGQIPLTILSDPSLRARVELRLSSPRLIFHLFVPSEGKCRIPTPTSEVCDLTLTILNTTLKVPVEIRSSGVFPLDVYLYTPGGSLPFAHDRDTIRSTAVSGVGVVLIAVAIASLALWWARDLRHGRRARQLVPAPEDGAAFDEEAADPPADGAPGPGEVGAVPVADAGTPRDRDVVVRDFFSTPAPEYQERPAQPRP